MTHVSNNSKGKQEARKEEMTQQIPDVAVLQEADIQELQHLCRGVLAAKEQLKGLAKQAGLEFPSWATPAQLQHGRQGRDLHTTHTHPSHSTTCLGTLRHYFGRILIGNLADCIVSMNACRYTLLLPLSNV